MNILLNLTSVIQNLTGNEKIQNLNYYYPFQCSITDLDDTLISQNNSYISDMNAVTYRTLQLFGVTVFPTVGYSLRRALQLFSKEINDIIYQKWINNSIVINILNFLHSFTIVNDELIFSEDKILIKGIEKFGRADFTKTNIVSYLLLTCYIHIGIEDHYSTLFENHNSELVNEFMRIGVKIEFGVKLLNILKTKPSEEEHRFFRILMIENVSKKIASEIILKDLGLSFNQTAFIGDGENDIDLMKAVSYSISVENAIQAIRHIARYKVGLNCENSLSSISNTLCWRKFPRNEPK
ncbi:uncharacterized protein CMU_036470 [Cryptosporidium muris RN66]|uniref:Haloacid dehalogenase-like hydrolase family protein n=1 Tax=Cryptosporidium muris (strain RN66) TaxID=441375 RepID=B6AGY2_CRYMR|nr:uncharacterized protein CMU_036470 [Cryptosporidium muris RN66]EEA07473.1 hypothetical protein CMU_036470 [Cryptosporidium muris RN66]|eukprot:XP_002141822.1 hypothetical protein [Cryptosporidium muris RN66]